MEADPKKVGGGYVYERVTGQIIADLEKGVRPWLKPWNGDHAAGSMNRPLRANGQPYRGINVLILWAAACKHGYLSPIWMTFKQALELGGNVRKGEKGNMVVYANALTKTVTDGETGEEAERGISFMKAYTVFNVDQVDGLPARFHAVAGAVLEPGHRIAEAEAFFAATSADVRHGGNQAYYIPSADRIQMPPFETFRDPSSYYAILAHEMTHWTKAKSRLDREFGSARFGGHGYAMEELVAELGAAFVCADLSLTPEPREEHAAYLQHWLTVMKADKRAIFTAAAHAQRAADYLAALQPGATSAAA